MSKASDIDFTQAIRSVMKKRHSSRKLDTKSLNLLNVIVNSVSGRLIEQFNAEYNAYPKSDSKACTKFAEKAVKKTFKGRIGRHAEGIGKATISEFNGGELRYELKEESHQLEAGVSKMCPSSHSLKKEAKEFLSDQLQRFAERVVAEIDCGENDEMQSRDIRQVLPKFLGPDVLKIALSEGQRSIDLLRKGDLHFKAPPFAPVLPPVEPPAVPSSEDTPGMQESGIFKTGLRKFLKDYDATLDKKAIEFIDKTLYQIAEFLAMYAGDVSHANGKVEVSDTDVFEGVNNEFPGMLREHALVQGSQDVDEYLLDLKVKARAAARSKAFAARAAPKKRKRSPKYTRLDFTSAILDIIPSVFKDTNVTIERTAEAEIEKLMNAVVMSVTNLSSQNSESGEVGISEVNDAVEKLLPGDLQHFACTFAANTLVQRLSKE